MGSDLKKQVESKRKANTSSEVENHNPDCAIEDPYQTSMSWQNVHTQNSCSLIYWERA